MNDPHASVPVHEDGAIAFWLTRLVRAVDPGDVARVVAALTRAQPGCAGAQVAWPHVLPAPAPASPSLTMVRSRLERAGLPHVSFGDVMALRLLPEGRATLLVELDRGADQGALLAALHPYLPLIAQALERSLRMCELEDSHRQLKRSESLQRALFAISDLAGSELEMAEVLRRLHGIVSTLMYAENFFIVRCDPQRRTMRFLYYADTEDTDVPPLNVDHPLDGGRDTLTWHLLSGGKPLMGSIEEIGRQITGEFAPIGPDALDWLGVPMKRDGEVHGGLVVQSYRQGIGYTAEDRALLEFVGNHVLTALERKQSRDELEDRVRRRTQELATANLDLQQEVLERQRAERLQAALFHLAQLATADIDKDEFYRRTHAVAGELINAENFFIALLSADRQKLEFPYYVDAGVRRTQERALGRGLSEYVLRSGRPLLALEEGLAALAARGEIDPERIGRPAVCWLGVPLQVGEEVIGLVAVQSYTPSVTYDQADRELLSFAALQIANSIHRRRAAVSLQHAYAELEQRVAERTKELRQEIAERERVEEQLKHEVMHDALTGLPNRSLLRDRLERMLITLQREPERRCALLYLDVDRFKVINDSLGHLAGDIFLKEIAYRLRSCVREPDVVARLAGDEFAILLEEVASPDAATAVARRVLDALEAPMQLAGRDLAPSGSMGIAIGGGAYLSADELLRDADTALYRAKEGGRKRYELFDETLARNAVDELALEVELRHALLHGEFVPYYQPIFRLDNGDVVGHEALLRWNHPRRGLLLPGDFVRVAQDCGQLEAIDWQLFSQACERMAQPDAGTGFVTINVSPQHLRHAHFDRRLLQLLGRSGLPPARLLIELTEGALLEDPVLVRATLERLRATGVQAALDDFGTGYSSLSYLHSLPLGKLKIDQVFVRELDAAGGAGADTVVSAVLALARALGIGVIAEGIETEAQRDALLAMGCEFGQGFLLGRPGPLPRRATVDLATVQQDAPGHA